MLYYELLKIADTPLNSVEVVKLIRNYMLSTPCLRSEVGRLRMYFKHIRSNSSWCIGGYIENKEQMIVFDISGERNSNIEIFTESGEYDKDKIAYIELLMSRQQILGIYNNKSESLTFRSLVYSDNQLQMKKSIN